jgi:UDP-N-acetylmuramoyl-tripeptide--D-alanyl-D-alanine ligase
MIHFSQLQHITQGKNIRFTKDWPVTTLLTDSRKAHSGEGGVFFAITGEHHDGHSYIQDLYQKGIRQFVVEREISFFDGLDDVNILVVSSSLSALQAVVSFHRSTLSLPVIGITGSNGKTIVKEWLFQVLSSDYKIAKNPGSYNSQLGVPLSVWQLQSHHGLGIFEAGISRPEEMKKLAAIIQPTIGIFTTLGSAHNEGFTSLQQKAMEKAVLFEGCKVVIYCKDHTLIDDVLNEAKFPTLTWGFASTAGVHLKNENGKFSVSFKGTSFTLTLPFSDKASIENCFHCVTVMLYLGYSGAEIQERIQSLESVPMRLELKEGINQSQIIDDTYNNDLAGLQISLDFLGNQHQKNKKRLILSDVLESGLTDEELARQISLLVDKHKIHSFVGIGPGLSAHRKYFSQDAQFFLSTEDFLDKADWDSIQQEAILVKGARRFAFEKIIERLQKKVHGTIMEVDLGAVVHNLNFFRARLKPSTKIMVMVKAFAYGSGSTEIANLLQYHKVDYLGVAYADEGIELRKDNITLPIMVMNPSEESFASILQYHLEPEVYSFKVLHSLIHFLRGRPCTIHVKLDTGMHRLGFSTEDLDELTGLLRSHPSLKVASVFSHLAGADEATHDGFSREQVSRFESGANKISSALGYKTLFPCP